MKKSSGFAKGAIILIMASVVTKIIGAIFKIPLSNLIGADGMGVFSVAYTIYSTLFILSTAGLPVAISKMVAEANALGRIGKIKSIINVALISFSFIGIFASFIMIAFAEKFTALVGNSMAYYSVIAVAPSLFFVSVVSIIRGYFQGLSDMVPTAISQILESLGKLLFGLALAYWLILEGYSFEIAAAGAIAGVSLGTLLSALYLLFKHDKQYRKLKEAKSNEKFFDVFKQIIKIAIPITVGSAVLSLTNLIDMFLVMNRLQSAAGVSEIMANKLYGAYNMSIALYNLPQTFIVAISVSIIPSIAANIAIGCKSKAKSIMESAFRIASVIALPAGVGFLTLSKPILNLLYYSKPEDVIIAAPLLSYLGLAVIFVALVSLTNSILQSVGLIQVPVCTMLIGGVVKIFSNYILVGIPDINISGAPIGTILCYGTIACLNLFMIKRSFKELSFSAIFIKPLLSAILMGAFAFLTIMPLTTYLGAKIGIIVTIALSALVYFAVLFTSGGLPKEDVLMLPKGEKIAKILRLR